MAGERIKHVQKPNSIAGGYPNGFTFCGQIIRNRDQFYASLNEAEIEQSEIFRACKKCLSQVQKITN